MSFTVLNIGISGLDSQSQRINAIGNNIANLQTLGFKRDTVTFAEEFVINKGIVANGAARHEGRGVKVSETGADWSQGPTEETGQMSHIAIRGTGFLPVSYQGEAMLTRVGDFSTIEDNGNPGTYMLSRPNGALLMGATSQNGDPSGPVRFSAEPNFRHYLSG